MSLIEADQGAPTASIVFTLAEILSVDLPMLSCHAERQLEQGLREVFSDPLLGADSVQQDQIAALTAAAPGTARAVLAL